MNGTSRLVGGPSRAIATVPDPNKALAGATGRGRATEDIPGAEGRARDLLTWCDALTDVGLDETARLSRVVARDVLELVEALGAERSARAALQRRCDRQQAILGRQADAALRRVVS
jgi:hypothetical protein